MTQATDLANAINSFVVGCKQDGIWDPIKACCIMAAWDGLAGALYPLKGAAPTNVNFVSGDYNRETGLVGDGASKYLNSNRAGNADPQNNQHVSVYATTANTTNSAVIDSGATTAGGTAISRYNATIEFRSQNNIPSVFTATPTGLVALSRSSPLEYDARFSQASQTLSGGSQVPGSGNYFVFTWSNSSGGSNARLSFYSIGESLDLAKLDTRVTQLMTDIGAAIP